MAALPNLFDEETRRLLGELHGGKDHDKDHRDTVEIVRLLMRIVARKSTSERVDMCAEICAVICHELGLDDDHIKADAMGQEGGTQ